MGLCTISEALFKSFYLNREIPAFLVHPLPEEEEVVGTPHIHNNNPEAYPSPPPETAATAPGPAAPTTPEDMEINTAPAAPTTPEEIEGELVDEC